MYLEPHIGEYPGTRKVEKSDIWDKVFKSGPSKTCGRQPLKNLKGYGLLRQTIFLQFF